MDSHVFETVAEMRTHLLGVLMEQGFVSREFVEQPAKDKSGLWIPPCLASITTAQEEFGRRKRQLLRALLCAALWPNVVLRPGEGQLVAKHQSALAFHPSSILGLQDALAAEAVAGDWNCPRCTFFCFGSREVCPQCETPKPAPQRKAVRQLRHRAFVYGEKVRSNSNPSGQGKNRVLVKDCCGVPVKALFLLGHRIWADYLSGRASVDGWVHCQAAPRDMAMLLGLRRRLQQVLSRRLTRGSTEAPSGEDPEVIDAVTLLLVLDVE